MIIPIITILIMLLMMIAIMIGAVMKTLTAPIVSIKLVLQSQDANPRGFPSGIIR